MKRILQRFRRSVNKNPQRLLDGYFNDHGLCCLDCGTLLDLDGLSAMSFVKCPNCQRTLFVPLRIRDFLLVEPIGAGGMASVYKAYHPDNPNEVFAVKILMEPHCRDAESIRSFDTEARTHSQITDHPSIPAFIESGFADGYHFYAMEFVKGERLVHRLEQHGKLPEKLSLSVLQQVLSALVHIREHGYLYRDVNAANVMLQHSGKAILIDFGLTLPIDEARKGSKDTRHVDGTPEFLPPERVYGNGEDERSVIYSLGILTYYMFTAEFLFKAQSIKGLAMKHVSKLRLASAPSLPKDISDDGLALVERMIEQDRENRFPSFEANLEATETLLESLS